MGGGKGGVGKSFIISNLAISLARSGKKVVVVDLDLGGANLHTCLGSDIPQLTLTDFFSGRVKNLEALINKSSINNLGFISGANDAVGTAHQTPEQHEAFLKALQNLKEEYVLLDLGAGTHNPTLDYFLLASRPLICVTPEPTSIENAYRFIKSAYFRYIKQIEEQLGLKAIVDEAMDHKNKLGIRTPTDLINRIIQMNPSKGQSFQSEIAKFQIYLVMNQVRTQNDVDTGTAIQTICKKYFGIEVHYVGYLDYDNAVWQAVRKRRPLVLEHPHSVLVHEFSQISRNLENDERYSQAKLLRTS